MKLNLAASVLCAGSFFLSLESKAFQIFSPVTTACHERIILGTLGDPTGFAITGQASVATLLQNMITKIASVGVPSDTTTRAMINEMSGRFKWESRSLEEQYLLTSMVAGIRSPDTSGFSIVDLNEVRNIHIRDDDQSAHSLRTSQEDFENGNPQAIADAKVRLGSLIAQINGNWLNSTNLLRKESWNFAFYGVQDVQIFSPAYDLGLIAHTLEDAYSHTLRDDSMNIVAVLNYVDAVNAQLNESMDGPAHSQRMDECNFDGNDFDQMRILEAARQTADLFNLVDDVLTAGTSDFTAINAKTDQIYNYRAGCNVDNRYCESTWYPISQSSVTKPFLGGCGTVTTDDFRKGPPTLPPGNLMLLAFLFTTPFLTAALLLRARKNRELLTAERI